MKRPPVLVTTKVIFDVEGKAFADRGEADRYAFAYTIANALEEEFPRTGAFDWIDIAEFIVKHFDVRPMGDDMASAREGS